MDSGRIYVDSVKCLLQLCEIQNRVIFCHRLSQTLARGITKAGVATEMVDLLSADTQELVEIVGRNSGLVIMAPPSDATEAQASLATVLSAVKPKKQKV